MSGARDIDQRGTRRGARVAATAILAILPVLVGPLFDGGSVLAAQAPRWEVDVNASRIRYDTAAALNAPSVTSLLEWRRPSLFARLSGGVTGFEGSGWSIQGRGDVARWLAPFGAAGPARVEIAAMGAASRHSFGFESFVGRTDLRLHAAGREYGGWIGAGLAVARNSFDSAAVRGFLPTAGVWARRGPVRATASYVHTRVAGRAHPEANAVLVLSRGLLDLSLYGGFRRSPFESSGLDESWVGGAATLWVNETAAVVLSGGRYSSDVLQDLPGGDFISIGVRLTSRRERPIPARVPTPIVYAVEDVRERGIILGVPDADRVEIAGDFNGWTLQPLERHSSGGWVVPAGLEPGVYRFNLRVDGERWTVPEGVPQVDDGFGGRVGLLIISGGAESSRP